MKEKDMKPVVPKEEAKHLGKQLIEALRTGNVASVHNVCISVMGHFGPQSIVAFQMPPHTDPKPVVAQPPMNPEQEKLEKLYSNVATNIWRIKNQILAEDNSGGDGETYKDSLDERAVSKIARYINSLMTALNDGGVEIVSDYVGKPHHEGSAIKVVSYEDRQDLSRDEYVEVLMPTVRWTNSQGQTRLLQPAEVVVGRPKNPPAENPAESI